ncbi:hypothetical protein SUGI_0684720 [Cryptomeria japonica]|nr:hypothetical protein SUGI_0684720 [Cryptomeria japonica]
MNTCMVLAILLLLIILPPQECNARLGPHNSMKNLKEIARQGGGGRGEQERRFKQMNQSNQKNHQQLDGGIGFMLPSGLRSKTLRFVFTLLPKGSHIPPSGPSKRHNRMPSATANSDP